MAKQRRDQGMGTIFQRADGRFYGGIEIPTADGKRRRKTVSSKRKDDVIKRLRQLRKDIDAGRVSTSPSVTLARYLADWLKFVVRPTVAPKTYSWYEQAVRLHIIPHIGNRRLEKLQPSDVRIMHELVAENASTSSAQQAHTTLRTALERAVKDAVLTRNVAAIVGKPGHNAIERGAYSFEQAKAIIGAAIAGGDPMWATMVATAFFTGARPGELLGLRWRYVDLDAGTITLEWQLQLLPSEHGCEGTCGKKYPSACPQTRFRVSRGFRWEPCYGSLCFTLPKTKTPRVVPMAAPLWAMLRLMAVESDDSTNPHDLVFHRPDGRPIDPKDNYRAWKTLLGDIKGLPPDAVPYCSRHTTATLLDKFGIDERSQMQIIGHSTAVAHRGYVHNDRIETNRAAINSALAQLMPGTK